jgi:hypothetical protein
MSLNNNNSHIYHSEVFILSTLVKSIWLDQRCIIHQLMNLIFKEEK